MTARKKVNAVNVSNIIILEENFLDAFSHPMLREPMTVHGMPISRHIQNINKFFWIEVLPFFGIPRDMHNGHHTQCPST
jgi:hypothetical protein